MQTAETAHTNSKTSPARGPPTAATRPDTWSNTVDPDTRPPAPPTHPPGANHKTDALPPQLRQAWPRPPSASSHQHPLLATPPPPLTRLQSAMPAEYPAASLAASARSDQAAPPGASPNRSPTYRSGPPTP